MKLPPETIVVATRPERANRAGASDTQAMSPRASSRCQSRDGKVQAGAPVSITAHCITGSVPKFTHAPSRYCGR